MLYVIVLYSLYQFSGYRFSNLLDLEDCLIIVFTICYTKHTSFSILHNCLYFLFICSYLLIYIFLASLMPNPVQDLVQTSMTNTNKHAYLIPTQPHPLSPTVDPVSRCGSSHRHRTVHDLASPLPSEPEQSPYGFITYGLLYRLCI